MLSSSTGPDDDDDHDYEYVDSFVTSMSYQSYIDKIPSVVTMMIFNALRTFVRILHSPCLLLVSGSHYVALSGRL